MAEEGNGWTADSAGSTLAIGASGSSTGEEVALADSATALEALGASETAAAGFAVSEAGNERRISAADNSTDHLRVTGRGRGPECCNASI